MEQYEMLPLGGFRLLRQILPYWKPEHILIRTCGSCRSFHGMDILRESLKGKSFTVRRRSEGLIFVIDGVERCCLKMSKVTQRRGWGLGYERFDANGIQDMHASGYPNPDDSRLPAVHRSIIHSAGRCGEVSIYVRITFPGKIPIRKLRLINNRDQSFGYYWTVVLPEE